jgi:hypothetical protein
MPVPGVGEIIDAQSIRLKTAGENFPRLIRVGEVLPLGSFNYQVLTIQVKVWEPSPNQYLGNMVSITISFDGRPDATFWVPIVDIKYVEQAP